MGQQQLLLLVLATVIVGLATVAGIQAFDEGQQQASQDALTQRALEIGNDLVAAHEKPSQFGGVDIRSDDAATIAEVAGYDSATPPADGAGDDASCVISSANPATVECASDGEGGSSVSNSGSNEYVEVEVDPDANDDRVSVSNINGTTIGT